MMRFEDLVTHLLLFKSSLLVTTVFILVVLDQGG
mgnify:CR=1 FL=1